MTALFSKLYRFFRSPHQLLLGVVIFCGSLLVFAFALVRVADLVPCPLCIVQRFFYALVGLAALIGYMGWWPRFTIRVASTVVTLLACIGWLVAARHVYLQRFQEIDSSSAGCIVSFGSFFDDVIFALGGTGNCAIVDWSFLGLSIADWSLIAFTGLVAAGIWIYLKAQTSIEASANTVSRD